MKRHICFALVLMLLLSGCTAATVPATVTTLAPTTATTMFTTAPTTVPTTLPTTAPTTLPTTAPTTLPTTAPTTVPTTLPTTAPTTEPTTVPTRPAHSPLYIEGVSVEKMIEYFNEVVLSIEYSTGDGNPALVQKWSSPLKYYIEGTPTDRDKAVLEGFVAQLNAIEGFPGIRPATDLARNVGLYFLDKTAFRNQFSAIVGGEDAEGAVQFWYYTASNVIYDGKIGYRTDISQQTRDSVILEEIVNLLGLNDTVKRRDSIVYQYASDATELSDVDWVILKLLYDPAIKCGMNAAQCEEVIRNLYW